MEPKDTTPPADGQPAPAPAASEKPEVKPEVKPEAAKPAESIAESAPVLLAESEVTRLLGETHLPEAAKARLSELRFKDEKELREAIAAEVEYVKKLTGAGKPTGLGESKPPETRITEADYAKRLDAIDQRYGLRR